jgi:serine/threonine protein kinase
MPKDNIPNSSTGLEFQSKQKGEAEIKSLDVKRFVNPIKLGEGGKAVAYTVLDTFTEKLKVLKLYKPIAEEKALKDNRLMTMGDENLTWGTRDYEARVMEILREVPHVVKLDGVIDGYAPENGNWVKKEGAHGLVRELADGQSLNSKALYNTSEFMEQAISQYLEAMKDAAAHGVSFADIKPDDVIFNPQKQEIVVIDLDLAEPLSENPVDKLRQWYADLVHVKRLIPVKFIEGNPLFEKRPVSPSEVEYYLENGHFGKPYDIDKAKEQFGVNLLYMRKQRNARNPEMQKRAKESVKFSSIQDFVASLRDNPVYKILFETYSGWGNALNHASLNSGSEESRRTLEMFQSASSHWDYEIENLFGVKATFAPSELARIAYEMRKAS